MLLISGSASSARTATSGAPRITSVSMLGGIIERIAKNQRKYQSGAGFAFRSLGSGVPPSAALLRQFSGAIAEGARPKVRPAVEDDPRDLSSVRKYLGVYLLGARDATVKFAEIYAKSGDQAAKADFEALLEDLSNNFAERTKSLLNDDRTDLDVEISVLRDRLAREGLVSE